MRVFLGAGLGFGISSSLFFILMLIGASHYSMITEIAILIVVLCLNTKSHYVADIDNLSVPNGKMDRFLRISFYAVLLSALVTFILLALQNPHGDADGLSMWNMRARFLFRGGEHWRDAFSAISDESTLPHKDYPLLWAGLVARTWTYLGYENPLVPIAVNMTFVFSTVGLLYFSLRMFQNRTQAYLASIVLLGTPFFIWYGAVQYVDIPLGFYFFSTMLLFYLQDHCVNKKYVFIMLSGTFAAMAAWTKNEGLLFLLCVVITRFLSFIFLKKDIKQYLKELSLFISGAMPILIIILLFKIGLAPSNDLTPQNISVIISNLADMNRHLQIIEALFLFVLNFGYWTFGLPFVNSGYCSIPLLLLFYLPFAGITFGTDKKYEIISSFILLGLMMMGYYTIYLITPHQVEWHLGTSLRRLLLQLWPSYLFAYFMIIRTQPR
jgi:hypothetical protein